MHDDGAKCIVGKRSVGLSWIFEALPLVALGAFIDFYIGKGGQKVLRSKLENWWIRLSYIKLTNFGAREAEFSKRAFDYLFGERLISLRRLYSSVITWILAGLLALYPIFISEATIERKILAFESAGFWIHSPAIIFFAISITITQYSLVIISNILANNRKLSIFLLLFFFFLQYILLCIWVPILNWIMIFINSFFFNFLIEELDFQHYYYNFFNTMLSFEFWRNLKIDISLSNQFIEIRRLFFPYWPSLKAEEFFGVGMMDRIVTYNMSIIPNFGRLLLFGIFLSSYLISPFHVFIMKIFARIIEYEKPVFTLLFGGIGIIFSFISKIL